MALIKPASEPTRGSLAAASPEDDGTQLTHVDSAGAARMVDVSEKSATVRSAVATGILRTTTEVIGLMRRDGLSKGDALGTARIAGIMGAKSTADLVPLCHPIALTSVTVELEPQGSQIFVRATVRTVGPTGVEMEALTAVAVAGLALHDMIKAVDPAAVMDNVRLEQKHGGKAGTWVRPSDANARTHIPAFKPTNDSGERSAAPTPGEVSDMEIPTPVRAQ
ncbi:cyclic pyranopterin monophosphate synthase MoaC [Rhodococcus opacus]|uniref:cyclic pyranopterin monophosphate synthase MoaC n=1 Tax=Rhodococcus opacus TaxID=37919 RepID=UPI000EAA276E|nr:cyclic pyranopterin monophosphate synthase MoaC [Rhodococcus opacus]RKM64867.1 cyclic pyranopterin monophosphate synthase MoaC [Rhodococcus opacus]